MEKGQAMHAKRAMKPLWYEAEYENGREISGAGLL